MKKQDFYLKQQDILEHAQNPQNYGLYIAYDFISEQHNPSCGDSVKICAIISKDNLLYDIRFEGTGCMLSLAMASKFTEFVKGKKIEEILALDHDIVTKLLDIELGPNRIQCGMLSVVTLIKGIDRYQKSLKT